MLTSRVLGLLSIILFALTLVTAVKLPLWSRLLGGLAQQYRFHHWAGRATGVTIVLHICWEFLSQPWSISSSLIFSTDPALLSAWGAFVCFILAFGLSFASRVPYRRWYHFHLLFPFAFLLGLVHAIGFRTDMVMDEAIIMVAALAGVMSLVAVALARFWSPFSSILQINSITKMTDTTWELQLSKPPKDSRREPFRAGDVVYVRFLHQGFTHAIHPFSVASCRLDPELRLYIKSLGRDTSHLQDLSAGDKVQVTGPFRELEPDPARPQVWVAGGIGIAPFLGLLHCMDYEHWHQPVRLVHFVRSAKEKVPKDSVRDILKRNPTFSWLEVIAKNGTALDFSQLDHAVSQQNQPVVMVCGPVPFMRAIRKHMRQLGVPRHDIKTEEFTP